MDVKQKGAYAEALALRYLQTQGLTVVQQNFTVKGGEIDLIMREGKTLVFVEVKARHAQSLVGPFESVTPVKIKRIQLAAQIFMLRPWTHQFHLRFDVIAVNLHNDQVDWLKDAF